MSTSPANSSFSNDTPPRTASAPTRPVVKHASSTDHQIDGNGRYSPFSHNSRNSRNSRNSTHVSLQQWEQNQRAPYHDYIHQLVHAGWDNLAELDTYMGANHVCHGLVVSILDISTDFTLKQWPDMQTKSQLKTFMDAQGRKDTKVRMYMVETQGNVCPGVIEIMGSSLALDPRFFLWDIHGNKHVFTPSQRHRAPFLRLGFGVLNQTTASRTDAEKFGVMVYIHPDEEGDGFTGIILFGSHTKIPLSARLLNQPPQFGTPIPRSDGTEPKSFRELYINSFEFLDLRDAVASPLFMVHYLFRLNRYCWYQIIDAIRTEDRRIHGISDTSIGHTEEIKSSLAMVQRGGSLGWKGGDEAAVASCKKALEEDFRHLVEQTDMLWQTREKISTIRRQNSEARWTWLTNAFTYFFAPITIISGIYGMNVSQISGSNTNPNIWQPFVAVMVMNVVFALALASSNWVQVFRKHGRKAGVKESLGFSVGQMGSQSIST